MKGVVKVLGTFRPDIELLSRLIQSKAVGVDF